MQDVLCARLSAGDFIGVSLQRGISFQMTDKEPWDSERWKDLPQDIQLNAGAGTLVLVCVTAELASATQCSFH